MKVDRIIKNAKIFTSDRDHPQATALAVKDGRFVYVGDSAGLFSFEGEVTDLAGEFIMPGIIDSHTHVTMGVGFEYVDMGPYIACDSNLHRRMLGSTYRVKVTCAHLERQDDADIPRFAELGVNANYTLWWHAENMGGDPYETWSALLGEKRANAMYRCKSVWNTGANVTWSSDDIHYGDFESWSRTGIPALKL